MRIISGRWGGRRLEAPPGHETRPLTDRIKQSLFDWLGQDLTGWRVADACAGCGGFGIEAASRGAAEVHLIEPGRHALPAVRANLAILGDPPEIRLHPRPFQRVLAQLSGLDLVFCDPPFPWYSDDRPQLEELVALGCAALSKEGRLVLRGETGEMLPNLPPGRQEQERRVYGRSWIAAIS
ncbi:hypothetical protein LBMAG53_20480 [Planctomycetota bacterium]|nr:hypothetical protein LBMAG53_20480 [Planctomycetota bacterium]